MPTKLEEPTNLTRHQWVSVAAYFKAEKRGFKAGKEIDDWLEAELEHINFLVDLFVLHSKEDGGMTLAGLQKLAILIGIAHAKTIKSEKEIIHLIQKASKTPSCFHSKETTFCDDYEVHGKMSVKN